MVEAYKIRAKALKNGMGTPPRPMQVCHALTAKFAAGADDFDEWPDDIALVNREAFDYTEWRKDNLFADETVDSLMDKAEVLYGDSYPEET